MAEAAAIGIGSADFWNMTPRELRVAFAGAAKRATRENQRVMFGSWHAGAFARFNPKKKLPELSQLLYKMGERRDMSDTELRGALLGWHKSMGGSVRVVAKGAISGSRTWQPSSVHSGQT